VWRKFRDPPDSIAYKILHPGKDPTDSRIPASTDRSLLGFGMPRIPGAENGPPRRALAVGNDPGNGIRLDNARTTRAAQVHPFPSAFPPFLPDFSARCIQLSSGRSLHLSLPSFP